MTGAARRRIGIGLALGALLALAPAAAAAGAPAEGPPEPAAKGVLVLPTRVPVDLADARATFDLLIANALQELGFTVDAAAARRKPDGPAPELAEARELYLELRFGEALAAAQAVRDARLARRGDLLGDPVLVEAELTMVRSLVDLGDLEEARRIAVELLGREPGLRLDPVDYPPAVQALWVAALARRAAMQPDEPSAEAIAAAGRDAGAAYAISAVAKRTADGVDWLVIQIVPTAGGEKPSRLPMALGAQATWARGVQRELERRFGPPAAAMPPGAPGVPTPADEKKVWYKSWWFWSAVGLVVVGGAVTGIAIGVDKGGGNSVTMDPQ
jgi:hypothetical protein